MNDEDRGLLRRALDALSGGNADPARQGLEQLVSEHGREQVAKAASDLGLEAQLTDEELAAIEAIAAGEGEGEDASGSDIPEAVDARLTKIEEAISKLAGKTEGETEGEALPENELALVKSGVPVDQIEAAQPMLRSQDEDARRAAFAFLAKQASPQRKALLAKERGSSKIEDGDEAEVADYKARLAKANGDTPSQQTQFEQLLAELRKGGAA